jgi:hypothetical protein
MKTRNLVQMAMCVSCVALIFAACSKSNSKSNSGTAQNTELATEADDQVMVSNESDAVSTDATNVIYSSPSTAGNSIAASYSGGTTTNGVGGSSSQPLGLFSPCDATVTWDTTSDTKTITITYNGSNCLGNRTRTGVVSITMPRATYWGTANASVSINISNLKITRKDGKSITINGTKTFTNTSGGHLIDLPNLPNGITHTITGSMSITFDNGTTKTWNEDKQRVFTYSGGVVITSTGLHTDSLGNTNVTFWGTNRDGLPFEALITVAKVIDESCEWRLVSGENEMLRADGATLTITYGLDANGEATSCPGTGTYYYKAVRINAAGLSFTKIFPY